MDPRRSFALLITVVVFVTGCGLLPEQEDKTRNWSAERFYTEASTAMRGGNYARAAEYYEKLDARYPYGRYAKQTKLDLAYAYYKDEEPEAALEALDRFIALYPTSSAVAYAYYLRGVVNFSGTRGGFIERFVPTDTSQRDPRSALDSYNDFLKVVNDYPDTVYAKDARRRVVFLRNNLAMSEVHVAQYYMDRGAYLAAAKRAGEVVENYQRTPAVKEALIIMVDAYTQLGMDELAKDSARVLELNLQKGTLVTESDFDDDDTLIEEIWELFKLDQ
jgi:outer membrane protein assembly factor BamD